MMAFALKLFDVVDLGIPRAVLLAGLVGSWIVREIGWRKEARSNG
jgi:hypothetical protein